VKHQFHVFLYIREKYLYMYLGVILRILE